MLLSDLFLNYTLPIMGEKKESAENYSEQFIPIANIITADCFNLNNAMRERAGLDVLTAIPYFTALTDELPYEDVLLRNVLPYGIAARLVIDDGEPNKMGFLENNYVTQLNAYSMAIYQPAIDVYKEW